MDESESLYRSGERFMEAVCRDASDGREKLVILALSALSAMIALDGENRWLGFLERRGYLLHFVDEIVRSDQDLLALLLPDIRTLVPSFVFAARVGLLNRIALTPAGVGKLAQMEVLWRLSQCRFISARPMDEDSLVGCAAGEDFFGRAP